MSRQKIALIVEDESDVASMYSLTVSQLGLKTVSKKDGNSALEWLNKNVPDVVLLDLNLPRVSGMDIIKSIRDDSRLKKTKVVIITANPEMAESVDNLSDLVLIKPTSVEQIRALITRLVKTGK